MRSKRETLNEVVKCCEIRFNHGAAISWKHGDFVDLSREIQRETWTNISPNTLKRIFGKISVDEDYVPQQATLDALKKYGKYVEPSNVQTALPSPPGQTPIKKTSTLRRLKPLLVILAITIVIIGYLTWCFLGPNNLSGKIELTRTEGHLPATAFFDLQLPETGDSLFVNFGDKSPLIYVGPAEKNAAHIYFIPGVFTVSIQTREHTIASTSAYIRSDKWIGLAFHRQNDIPNDFYKFPAFRTGSDSVFQITNNQLSRMGLDTTGVILTRLCNYSPVLHNSDNFIFETTFKNVLYEKSNYCRSTQFQISGSNSMIRFKLVSSGCSLRVLNVVSEKTFRGATNNLSQFVLDLKKWNTVKLVNQNKHVTLSVNGKLIFTGTYQRSLGEIKGLFLEFEGTGLVKSCALKTYDGKMLYNF